MTEKNSTCPIYNKPFTISTNFNAINIANIILEEYIKILNKNPDYGISTLFRCPTTPIIGNFYINKLYKINNILLSNNSEIICIYTRYYLLHILLNDKNYYILLSLDNLNSETISIGTLINENEISLFTKKIKEYFTEDQIFTINNNSSIIY